MGEGKDQEMITVEVKLYRKHYDFVKAYVDFFGKKTTLEDFMREAVYDAIRTVYTHLEQIGKSDCTIPTGINGNDWLGKFQDVSFITLLADDE
jgi:hypothetical protein